MNIDVPGPCLDTETERAVSEVGVSETTADTSPHPAHDASTTESSRESATDDDPERIAATTGGYGFRLADCVNALCNAMTTPAPV